MLKNEICLNSKYILRKNYTLDTRKPYSQEYLKFLCKYYDLPLHKDYTPFRILNSYKPKGLQIIY